MSPKTHQIVAHIIPELRDDQVFHEGLKSWSCCRDVNKPVLDFDEFMKIPGCSKGVHTDEVLVQDAPKVSGQPVSKVPSQAVKLEALTAPNTKSDEFQQTFVTRPKESTPTASVEEEEDLNAVVQPGTACRRKGCKTVFVGDEVNRLGDGEGTVCTYHPAPPIFHEGSKGYLCCKRRVLEFDEFLKIEGCKRGRHLFVPKTRNHDTISEELTDCRVDHYQTRTEVHVSIFAKQVDRDRSTIQINESKIHFDLLLAGSKRFRRTLQLFGPVDEASSYHQYFSTKVEVILKKKDGRSWAVLEKTDKDIGNVNLTFGVGGRTGTIGAKQIITE